LVLAGERCKSDEVKEALRYSLTKGIIELSNKSFDNRINATVLLMSIACKIDRSIFDGIAHVATRKLRF